MKTLDYSDIISDKTLSHDLHQKFVINISHMILLIVNKISFPDQKLIQHLTNLIPKNKIVGIIHNFQNLNSVESVESYIVTDILQGNSNLEKKIIDIVIFIFYL